ncbi:MAG: hypothetical protein ACE5OZ_17165 [Candidatus Heimdallarchaeota archaeon]
MPEYYLSLERRNKDPRTGRIIAIAFQELERAMGQPVGDLRVLPEWTSSEGGIIREFLEILDLETPWSFVPIGFDLRSDFRFLRIRAEESLGKTLDPEKIYENLPSIDLLPTAVLMNKGRFRGTSLAWLVGQTINSSASRWYRAQEYDRVLERIYWKKELFLEFYGYLRRELPCVWAKHEPLSRR